MMEDGLAITHYTLTSAFGRGLAAQRAGLMSGRSMLVPHTLADGTACMIGQVAGSGGGGHARGPDTL